MVVQLDDDFRQKLVDGYRAESRWALIKDTLGKDPDAVQFKERKGVLLYINDNGEEVVCIPKSLESEIFRLVHNYRAHAGFHRAYALLRTEFYVPNMSRRLRQYIHHCPECTNNQTTRHRPYGELRPIHTATRPFDTIRINFILALPKLLDGTDCILTITDKFSKRVALISGNVSYITIE